MNSFSKFFVVLGLGITPFYSVVVQAQPVIETNNATQTQVNELVSGQFVIDGGAVSRDGKNLFHDFDSFNLDANQVAIFLNSPNATNLFSTISGGSPSFLDGLIGVAKGNPNLYFINPAGIIFGENVQLNVPGDFVATTATALGFENGWLNAIGSNDFASLVGEPSKFAFNTGGTVGDILMQGNISAPGDIGLIGGSIQGDRHITTPQDLLITTASDQNIIRLQQPGNLLSLELDTTSLDRGNALDFSVNKLPQLLTGSGDIRLNEISAQYGIVAAEGELTLNNSQLQTDGHLALLGQGITTNRTDSSSGLNQLLISGELAGIYQNQKPFLEAIANKINFEIEADPIDGTPIIVTDDLIDNVAAETLNAADIRLKNSQFTGQNIYILGDNIDVLGSGFTTSKNVNLFALNNSTITDTASNPINIASSGTTSIRANRDLTIGSFNNPDSEITSQSDLFVSAGNLTLRKAILNSQGNFLVNGDNLLLQNSSLTTTQNLELVATDSLVLEDLQTFGTRGNFSSNLPLQLKAGKNLILESGDILKAITPKSDSIFQAGSNILVRSGGESIELLGNFSSGRNIQVGDQTNSEILIEGGTWEAAENISLLTKDRLIIQDFHDASAEGILPDGSIGIIPLANGYGQFKAPLSMTANNLNFVGDDLIEIYLSRDSQISSTQDFSLTNTIDINIIGNIISEGDISLVAENIEIGFNLDRLENSLTWNDVLAKADELQLFVTRNEGIARERYSGSIFSAGGDLSILSAGNLLFTDSRNLPLKLSAENITVSGNSGSFFAAAYDPTSQITANQSVTVASNAFIQSVGSLNINSSGDITFQAPSVSLAGGDLAASNSISFLVPNSLEITNRRFIGPDDPFTAIAPTINFGTSNNIRIDLTTFNGGIEATNDLLLNATNNLFYSGDLSTLGNLTLTAGNDIELVRPYFEVGGNLTAIAANELSLRDYRTEVFDSSFLYEPIQLFADGAITLQGSAGINIPSYDGRSLIRSGADTTLISDGNILSNLRYESGGDFRVENLAGQPADWLGTVNVFDTNPFRSVYRRADGQIVPIGQVNLAQVDAEGAISFRNFTGRSLILEAGETITLNQINLEVPIAFGYASSTADLESPPRVQNFPDTVLSITGGQNFTAPAQSVFFTNTNPFADIFLTVQVPETRKPLPPGPTTFYLDEFNQVRDAIAVNDPNTPPVNILPVFAVGGDDIFIDRAVANGFPNFSAFAISIPSGRSFATASASSGLSSSGISLVATSNPLDEVGTPAPNSNLGRGAFNDVVGETTQDLIQRGNSQALSDVAPTEDEDQTEQLKATCLLQENQKDQEIDQELRCQQEQVELARQQENERAELTALDQLGLSQYQNNQYQLALETYQQRFELAESTQNSRVKLESLLGLTQVYSALGDYAAARQQNETANELLAKLRSESDGSAVDLRELEQAIANNYGFLAYAQERYQMAVAAYEKSLALAQRTKNLAAEIETLTQLGLVKYQLKDYAQVKALQQQAVALASDTDLLPQQLRAYEGLAIAEYSLQNYDAAVTHFKQALKLAEQLGDRHGQARQWSGLGDTQYQQGKATAAVQSLENAIQLWEDLRADLGEQDLFRVSLFETQETTYSTLQEILIETDQFEQALEVTERGRSRAFVELLERSFSPQAAEQDIEAPDIEQMRRIAAEQQATIVSYSIGRKVIETASRRQLVDSELWVWVVQPNGQVDFRRQDLQALQAQGQSIESLIADSRCFGDRLCILRSQAQRGNRSLSRSPNAGDNVDPNLGELHNLLIAPIQDLLPATPEEEVIFVPHRSLFLVPFAALQDVTGRYLIQDHTIRTAPSIQVLDLTRQQRQQVTGEGITIVGNPTMPKGLTQLPGTATEAQAIANLFDTEFITGDDATPTLVTQTFENSRFIHLATHGLLDGYGDDAAKIPGAIALAPTEADDGFLTASEIMQLRLNAEMVVLSACDTGRGDITEDGVIGLSRSFMGAGVPSVVVSLWQVPDESTSDLMIGFYEQLQENPNKAQALRQAMLANLEKYPQPRDWAAFTLMGET